MYTVTRRSFVTAACAAPWLTVPAGTPAGGTHAGGGSAAPPRSRPAAVDPPRYIEPACERLIAADQQAVLAALHVGGADFPGVPTQAFFATLLTLTVEGFFSHTPHGAQRDRIAWPMSGFPGAHAAL